MLKAGHTIFTMIFVFLLPLQSPHLFPQYPNLFLESKVFLSQRNYLLLMKLLLFRRAHFPSLLILSIKVTAMTILDRVRIWLVFACFRFGWEVLREFFEIGEECFDVSEVVGRRSGGLFEIFGDVSEVSESLFEFSGRHGYLLIIYIFKLSEQL